MSPNARPYFSLIDQMPLSLSQNSIFVYEAPFFSALLIKN